MRNILVVILLQLPLLSSAQKNHIYADAGLSLAYGDPGFSATYNFNAVKWLGLGAGVQGYVFHPATTNERQFTPAVFGDIRFRIRSKKISQYFLLTDFGINFYQHNNAYTSAGGNYFYSVPKDNGTYFGLGVGYFLRLTPRGWGPYVTIKAINNFYKKNELNVITNEQRTLNATGGTLVVSLGFRFLDDIKRLEK